MNTVNSPRDMRRVSGVEDVPDNGVASFGSSISSSSKCTNSSDDLPPGRQLSGSTDGRGLAPISPCWHIASLERLAKKLLTWQESLASAEDVFQEWLSAVDGSPNVAATETSSMRRSLKTLSVRIRAKSNRKCQGKSMADASNTIPMWLHLIFCESPAGHFFEALEKVLRRAGPRCFVKLSKRFLEHASCGGGDELPYHMIVQAVADAVGSVNEDCNTGKCPPRTPLQRRGEWEAQTMRLLQNVGQGEGLSLDAFGCVCLGRRTAEVQLYLYNMSNVAERLAVKLFLGIDGIWHSGLVAHDHEYWYGGRVHRTRAGQSPFGEPQSCVVLGRTLWSQRELLDIVVELSQRFSADAYDVLDLNCNDFCDALSLILCGCHIPGNIRGQAELALKSPIIRMLKPYSHHFNTNSSYSGSCSSNLDTDCGVDGTSALS